MKSFKTMLDESRGHKILDTKMKELDSLKSFSYPTPEERRAQIAKDAENKKKTSVKEEEDHGYIEESTFLKTMNKRGDKKSPSSSAEFDRRTSELVNAGDHDTLLKHLSTHVAGKNKTRDAAVAKLRNSVISKMKKESIDESEELDEANQEHEYIMQSLADKDINSRVKDGKVVVHKDNISKAKSHLKRIGHSDMQVVHEENENLEEAMVGHTYDSLTKEMKNLGWNLSRMKGSHHLYTHPKSKKPIPVMYHKGELSRPTTTKILKQAKQFISEDNELISFKNFILESEEIVEAEEILLEDLDSRLANHIRTLRSNGHNVVISSRGRDGRSAKFVSTDKEGKKRIHTVTVNGVVHQKIDGIHDEDEDSHEMKKSRGRPSGSKSGANVKV